MSKEQCIKFAAPRVHKSTQTNAEGPIVGLEIMHTDDDVVYWSVDGNGELTAYDSLDKLCEEYGFDLSEITAMVMS